MHNVLDFIIVATIYYDNCGNTNNNNSFPKSTWCINIFFSMYRETFTIELSYQKRKLKAKKKKNWTKILKYRSTFGAKRTSFTEIFCSQKLFLNNCIITFYSLQQNHAVPMQRFTNKKKWCQIVKIQNLKPQSKSLGQIFTELWTKTSCMQKTDNKTETNMPTQNHPHNQQPSKAWETPIKLKSFILAKNQMQKATKAAFSHKTLLFHAHRLLPVQAGIF